MFIEPILANSVSVVNHEKDAKRAKLAASLVASTVEALLFTGRAKSQKVPFGLFGFS